MSYCWTFRFTHCSTFCYSIQCVNEHSYSCLFIHLCFVPFKLSTRSKMFVKENVRIFSKYCKILKTTKYPSKRAVPTNLPPTECPFPYTFPTCGYYQAFDFFIILRHNTPNETTVISPSNETIMIFLFQLQYPPPSPALLNPLKLFYFL